MPRDPDTELMSPSLSRTMVHRALAGVPTRHHDVNEILAGPHARARLVRATAGQLRTLLVFTGGTGLLLLPYHSDPNTPVECVLAPAELSPHTWLAALQPQPARSRRSPRPGDDSSIRSVNPRSALRETAAGRSGWTEVLSVALRPVEGEAWQALRVTDHSTRWGFAPGSGTITLRPNAWWGMWALLCSVVAPCRTGGPVRDTPARSWPSPPTSDLAVTSGMPVSAGAA